MNALASLTQNTFFGILTVALGRVGNIVLFIAIVDAADVEGGGTYNLALAFFFIASRFAFWGLDHLLTREVAKDQELGPLYIGNFLLARSLLAAAIILLFGMIVHLLGYDSTTELVILIMLLSVFPENINNICWSAFAAYEEYHLTSIGVAANVLFKLGLGLLLLRQGAELVYVVLAVLVGNLVAMVINLVLVHRRYMTTGWQRPDRRFLTKQLRIAIPFIFIGFFFILDNRLDNVLLSLFSNEKEIGLYGAAMAIIVALSLLPEGYRIAILPVMARYLVVDASSFHSLYARSYRFLLAIALPLTVASIIMADGIIQFVYRQDLPGAVLALRTLAVALVFMFLNILNNRLLIVHNRQNVIARFLVVAFVANLLSNLLLLSRFGAQGAAVSRVLSVFVLFLLTSYAASRLIGGINRRSYMWRLLLSTLLMGIVLWQLAPWGIWVQLVLGSIVYFLLLILTQFISPNEIRLLRQLLTRRATNKM